ncbi:MAG: TetR/AcrR family transcriptional regulator [Opitutales bacterium]
MPRKRSRPNTEQRFVDAVLELVAENGCEDLGVNHVAQRAGADKVLIYRYFGGLDGLLRRVARSHRWLPTADELWEPSLSGEPKRVLADLARLVARHLRMNAATRQLCLWRHAVRNPLTEQYTAEWNSLWKELPEKLSRGLDYEARRNWTNACSLLALTIQAELAGEGIDPNCLDTFSAQLVAPAAGTESTEVEADADVLPTNLL